MNSRRLWRRIFAVLAMIFAMTALLLVLLEPTSLIGLPAFILAGAAIAASLISFFGALGMKKRENKDDAH